MNAAIREPIISGEWSSAAASVWALVSGFPRARREDRLLTMLQAYVDDSGNSDPPVYVLAGFVAPAKSWAEFSDDWKAVLDLPDLPIEYFKANEAAACKGQFYGWSEERRNERVNRLIAVLKKHVTLGVYSVVHHETFRRIFEGKLAKGMDSPHFFAYIGIMHMLIRHQHCNQFSGKVDFIFDQKLVTLKKREAWDLFVKFAPSEAKEFIGSPPIERDDKLVLPLQAADLLAWKVRREFDDKHLKKRQPYWPWDSLDSITMVTEGWDSQRLKDMQARIRAMRRSKGLEFPLD